MYLLLSALYQGLPDVDMFYTNDVNLNLVKEIAAVFLYSKAFFLSFVINKYTEEDPLRLLISCFSPRFCPLILLLNHDFISYFCGVYLMIILCFSHCFLHLLIGIVVYLRGPHLSLIHVHTCMSVWIYRDL